MKKGFIKNIILKNELIKNTILNIVANAIPVFLLQLILLPFLSRYLNSEEYGLTVTIMAFLNVVPSTLGNTLNNIRLLHNKSYKENNYIGDFNIILVASSLINIIIITSLCASYLKTEYSRIDGIIHMLLIVFFLFSSIWLFTKSISSLLKLFSIQFLL